MNKYQASLLFGFWLYKQEEKKSLPKKKNTLKSVITFLASVTKEMNKG